MQHESVTKRVNHGTSPHGAFRSRDSCPLAQADFSVRIACRSTEGTATSTTSSGFLCSISPSEPERDSHKHHIKWISLFEQPIGTRKGQPQTPCQADFSVRNSPSKPGRDSRKHHIKWISLFEQPIGTRKGQPQAPYQADFSVRTACRSPEGTAASTISSGSLCSNGPLGERAMGTGSNGPPG